MILVFDSRVVNNPYIYELVDAEREKSANSGVEFIFPTIFCFSNGKQKGSVF